MDLASGHARRLSRDVFREVDVQSDAIHSPVPPEVVDGLAALARLEVEEKTNWGIENLLESHPLDSETTFAMNALNRKRRDEGLIPLETFNDVIIMALAAVKTD